MMLKSFAIPSFFVRQRYEMFRYIETGSKKFY